MEHSGYVDNDEFHVSLARWISRARIVQARLDKLLLEHQTHRIRLLPTYARRIDLFTDPETYGGYDQLIKVPSEDMDRLLAQYDRPQLFHPSLNATATTLAAMAYRVRQGREFVTPPTGLSYTGSFLYQMDCLGQENYVPNPVLEKALDVLFLLHADHELNASSTTVLQTGSSLVDPYSAIAAGCASLYGPLHGGANEAVIRMLISIGKPENVPAFIEAVKKREKVLSGFGHRVYKTSDPRSFIVRKTADEVFKVTGKDELLETAMALHEAAMKDEYFIKRRLAPNVDFCGLIYRAMGFPLDFFPVLFAVPRVVGWLAHWRQMMLQEGGVKIWRPRQIYVGPTKRDYVPVEKRVAVEGPRQEPSEIAHSGITKRTNLASFKNKAVAKL
ncbi:citrate synthase I [Coprinopsis cinerea okayama7|uniref:Citrate synthase n=1 Tax=Coprinopsis cinerea (strain Okayama-7 / 130 / ATCC MYA-4618 / FGSC 9003) TaxID=240176 RepID=D6RM97_COPC7|nr:citrate synthase I [Coprinopsis cinerea okayama7\|eukprot:XP_002911404.1 citrate synthase I [Coprinopsis cinerea okayama7\